MSAALVAARRRPVAIVALFGIEAIVSWVLAAPWAESVARTFGAHPDGDRALFWAPGMPLLLDLEHRLGAVFAALTASTAIGLAVYAVLSVFLLGALIAALAEPMPLRRAFGRGAETFFRLLGVAAASVVVRVVAVALLVVIPAYSLSRSFSDPRVGAAVALAIVLLGAALLLVLGAATDLARARVVARDDSALAAMAAVLREPRVIIAQALAALPRELAALGLLGYGAAISTRASSIALIFVVHQLIALLRVALRAAVLARALRHTGASPS